VRNHSTSHRAVGQPVTLDSQAQPGPAFGQDVPQPPRTAHEKEGNASYGGHDKQQVRSGVPGPGLTQPLPELPHSLPSAIVRR
jgi:hypothetical protein